MTDRKCTCGNNILTAKSKTCLNCAINNYKKNWNRTGGKKSSYQVYIKTKNGCEHFWTVDQNNFGICKTCSMEKQFKVPDWS